MRTTAMERQQTIQNDYFEWLYSKVCTDEDHRKLLHYLHSRNFEYYIPMDANRESDGISLRYLFASEFGIPEAVVATEIDIYECSVLEMMIALCSRMESDVMSDPEFGDRTSEWFWLMLDNLGISFMTDKRYSELYLENVIGRFLAREYEPNGKGGLFVVNGVSRDLRTVEIWEQAMWFLHEYLEA